VQRPKIFLKVIIDGQCTADFQRVTIEPIGKHPDHNANGFVCVEFICPGLGPTPGTGFPRCRDVITVVIDDIIVRR